MMASVIPAGAIYDVCIVGAGMIGSSAARHAVQIRKDGRSLSVCLIGPDEPKNRADQSILSSHYDEARITRSTASNIVWATLSNRSIKRYRQLEHSAGVHFYEEVGCLTASERKYKLENSTRYPREHVGTHTPRHLDGSEIRSLFPYLYSNYSTVPPSSASAAEYCKGIEGCEDAAGVFEVTEAGYINPRKLCLAQQMAAIMGGCHVIHDTVNNVTEVQKTIDNKEVKVQRVEMDSGQVLYARSVLLATGAFTQFRRLLPDSFRLLCLKPISECVIFVELSTEDAFRLKNMPSMVLIGSSPAVDNDCYILPPVKYPDGKVYLKLGHINQCQRHLKTPDEVVSWLHNPVPADDQMILYRLFLHTFPDIRPVSVHYDTCVIAVTPSRRPYIDLLNPQLGVALGGNGSAAKCCDEIGRLAVNLLVSGGQWTDTELPREAFQATFQVATQNSSILGSNEMSKSKL